MHLPPVALETKERLFSLWLIHLVLETMKFVAFICLYIAILFQQIQHLESISCFQCSLLGTDQIECPSKKEDISKWIDLKDKYVFKSDSKSFSCLVGVDKSLKVYYQVRKSKWNKIFSK